MNERHRTNAIVYNLDQEVLVNAEAFDVVRVTVSSMHGRPRIE
jgi:hypothetical protein